MESTSIKRLPKRRITLNSKHTYFRSINTSRNLLHLPPISKPNESCTSRMIMSKGKDLKFLNDDSFKSYSNSCEFSMYSSLDLSPDHQSGIHFKIEKIPKSICLLTNLKELKLDTNDLVTLPPEIGDLTHLERLSLSNNSLTTLPDTLEKLNQLKSIHLSNNKFKKIPMVIFNIKKLVFLDLTSNLIKDIDKNICNLKKTLKHLFLYGNKIQLVPEWIDELSNLEELWLGNNCLTSIPLSLTNIKRLDWSLTYISVMLDENPIEKPPLKVCRDGFTAIKHWYGLKNKQ